jgi:hypothetical protein
MKHLVTIYVETIWGSLSENTTSTHTYSDTLTLKSPKMMINNVQENVEL